MENPQEKLVRYLQDAHAAEVGVRNMLEGFLGDTHDPNLKLAVQEHLTATRAHEDRLAQLLRKFNAEPNNGKGFFNTVMARMGEFMNLGHDDYDRTTQNIIKAYATEHLECGMYEALKAYAKAIGDQDVAQVAEEIQQEEKQTSERLWPMIEKC